MERRGRLNGITLLMSHSLPGLHTHTNTLCGQKDGAGEAHTWAGTLTLTPPLLLTLYSEGPFQGSILGMFGTSVGCFSSLPWTLEFTLDSVRCFQEVRMLTLALQSR